MPIVNDNPETIYVRGLDNEAQNALKYVKGKLKLKSNSEAVLRALKLIEQQDKQIADLKSQLHNAKSQLAENRDTFAEIKSAFKLLTNL